MAKVNITNVNVLDNPTDFGKPFQFQITFDCHEALPDDLEWKIVYVGSAESKEYDQVLDTVVVGPVPEGRHMFVFAADAPDPLKIPKSEVVGVTVILVTCAYRGQEFISVGYYVATEYTDAELRDEPPEEPVLDKLRRYVIADQPRITRYTIKWDDLSSSSGGADEQAGTSAGAVSNAATGVATNTAQDSSEPAMANGAVASVGEEEEGEGGQELDQDQQGSKRKKGVVEVEEGREHDDDEEVVDVRPSKAPRLESTSPLHPIENGKPQSSADTETT